MPARQGNDDERVAAAVSDDVIDDEPRADAAAEPAGRPGELSAAGAGAAGLRHMTELTAKEAEGVTLVEPAEHGWVVDVEIVEDRRIPSSGDMLALYETELDLAGNLLSYRRVRRYKRGSGDTSEAFR